MPTSTATSQNSFQRVLREQETLVNKILGSSDNSSARLYAMQTMCYILLAFHTVKSTSNTFESQTEDVRCCHYTASPFAEPFPSFCR